MAVLLLAASLLRIKPKGDKDQSCISLLYSSSIGYQLVYNVYESDTSAGRLKVPFAVTGHI